MTLVRVARPETETHLALIVSALEAEDIPFFVHNAGMGGLMPGLQIPSYNARTLMVPAPYAENAMEIIAALQLDGHQPLDTGDKLRVLFEAILLGWFVPARRRRRADSEDSV